MQLIIVYAIIISIINKFKEVKYMRNFSTSKDIAAFGKVISSEVRVKILQYLYLHQGAVLSDLSDLLQVSRAAITQNIKILQAAELVGLKKVTNAADNITDSRKICYLLENRFLVEIGKSIKDALMYTVEIPVGQYVKYKINPTCGLSTTKKLIGRFDEPIYFDDPQRINASILWFKNGFVEYNIPNYLKDVHQPLEIQLSLEISSEAPGVSEYWPSDITFQFNDKTLGTLTCPSDFGNRRGIYTPSWWSSILNQYGLMLLITINDQGTFFDGYKVSSIGIGDLDLHANDHFSFKLLASEDAKNPGGLTIFGKGFGDYNQDITFRMIYRDTKYSDKRKISAKPKEGVFAFNENE